MKAKSARVIVRVECGNGSEHIQIELDDVQFFAYDFSGKSIENDLSKTCGRSEIRLFANIKSHSKRRVN